MKTTCYLRVAKLDNGRHTFNATSRPSYVPLTDSQGAAYPTCQLRLILDIPPGVFGPDAEVKIEVPEHTPLIEAEVEAVGA